MKRTTLLAGSAVLIAVLAAGVTVAHDRGGMRGGAGGAEAIFDRFDTDGDGSITREEFEGAREARFAEADADGDGLLSAEELLAAAQAQQTPERMQARVDRMLERLDANEDGALSIDEMPQPRQGGRMFERADADGDGVVTQAEVDELMLKRGEGRGFGRGGHGKGGHGKGRGHGRQGG